MKKLIPFLLLLALSTTSFGQQINPSPPLTRSDYLKKSKAQKTGAFILLGSGAILFAIISPGNVSFDVLPVLAVGGSLLVLGSIPLFIASGKNKRKGLAMTAAINLEDASLLQHYSMAHTYYPAVSLKISLP